MVDVVVIGGGISGLAVSYFLKKAGFRIALLERDKKLGGVICSKYSNGYLLEHGPTSTLYKPALKELVASLQIEDRVLFPGTVSHNRYFALPTPGGFPRLVRLPQSPGEVLRTRILSTKAKFRVLLEPFCKKSALEDEDVHSFVTRRLGRECADLVSTLLGGIWACDTHLLSCRSALPFLWDIEQNYRSIFFGAARRRSKNGPQTSRPQPISFINGLSELVQRIADALDPESIYCGSNVENIKLSSGGVTVTFKRHDRHSISCKQVILTTPGPVCAELLESYLPKNVLNTMREIPYAPIGLLNLGLHATEVKNPLAGFGFLVHPNVQSHLLGVFFSSSVFKNRAPDGYHLLTCFLGGVRHSSFLSTPEDTLVAEAIETLSSLLEITTPPERLSYSILRQAIPNYPLSHYRIQNAISDFHNSQSDIRILANWCRGIGIGDRVDEAKKLSEEIVELFTKRQKPAVFSAVG